MELVQAVPDAIAAPRQDRNMHYLLWFNRVSGCLQLSLSAAGCRRRASCKVPWGRRSRRPAGHGAWPCWHRSR